MARTSTSVAPETVLPEVDLRPLTTSELIDRGFSLYRQHFAGLLLLALLSQIAPLLLQIASTSLHLVPLPKDVLISPGTALTDAAPFLAMFIGTVFIGFCFEMVMTFYIADAYLGKIPSVKSSFGRFAACVISSFWTCAVNLIFYTLTFIFPVLALLAVEVWYIEYPPASFVGVILTGLATFLLLIASLAPFLIVFMRLMVTVPVVALEKLSGWVAVKRSATLVRYDPGLGILYWGEMRLSFLLLPLLVIELLTYFFTSTPMVLSQIDDVVRQGSASQFGTSSDAVVIGSQILTYFASALILPLYVIATTLFYYDVRIRREGFDLEFMADRLEKST